MGNVSPPPEPKREDLTERLKKEFGLTVDAEDEDDTPVSKEIDKKAALSNSSNFNEGDATPEEDSPPPPPSAVTGSSLSSIHRQPTMTRLPDQIAQYPSPSASNFSSSVAQSGVDMNTAQSVFLPKGQLNSTNVPPTSSGQSSRFSSHQSQQTRSSYSHSSGSYEQPQHQYNQRHPPPPSRSHLPVNHPGSRMTYPPPLPPASVIANAPHPNKMGTDRDVNNIKTNLNNFKRSNSSREKEYYCSQQHIWSSERDNRGDRDREQRSSSGSNRSYYASTNSRGISDRTNNTSRPIGSGNYSGDKIATREYNRREYSQIRSASASERTGAHGGSASQGTDRDLRGGGSEHGSSRLSSSNNSSRSSKSSYRSNSYYNN